MKEVLRRLVIRAFHVTDIEFADKPSLRQGVLSISKEVLQDIIAREELVVDMTVSILKPGETRIETNTIMDILPISTKVLGKLGEGITHTITGAYVVLCGCDEDGKQMHEFGSSEGILSEQIYFGRAGTPAITDFIIHVDVLLKGGRPFDRLLPTAAFRACDNFLQDIRETLKTNDAKEADEIHEFYDKVSSGKKRVALIKQVSGQGAMYDNLIFPDEPSGYQGGISVIDIQNFPVILSPNEYRDGAIRAMD
jgi:D-proline reductase (dithiol) PrdD